MKQPLLVLALAAFAGCGGSGDFHGKFVAACNEQGDSSEEFCECMADKADEHLTDEQKEYVLASMEGDESRAAEMEKGMEMKNQEQVGRFMAGAFECGMSEAQTHM